MYEKQEKAIVVMAIVVVVCANIWSRCLKLPMVERKSVKVVIVVDSKEKDIVDVSGY